MLAGGYLLCRKGEVVIVTPEQPGTTRRDVLLVAGGAIGAAVLVGGQPQPVRAAANGDPIYDVKVDFGATGDGSTNDTAAIQAAEDAASGTGGVVYFPPGVYVSAGIVKRSNAHWKGAGVGQSTLKLVNNTPASTPLVVGDSFAGLTGSSSSGGISAWSIRELSFDGNKFNNGSHAVPLLQWYGFGFLIDSVSIVNANQDAVYSEWGSGSDVIGPAGFEARVSNVSILQTGRDAIQWNGPHDSMFSAVLVENAGRYGVWVQSKGGSGVFNACHVWGGGAQWSWYLDEPVTLASCQGEGATAGAIWARQSGIQIVGGAYFGTPVGLRLGVTGGNAVSNASATGVHIYNCSGSVFDLQNDGGANALEFYSEGGNGAVVTGSQAYNTVVMQRYGSYTFMGNGSTASVTIQDGGGNGANLRLRGNGTTTPSKTIRAQNGSFQVLNDAYRVIFQNWDNGDTFAAGRLYPGLPGGGFQTGGGIHAGPGVPSNGSGNNGDYYFRTDTPGTPGQRIYVKVAGVWTGIL